MTDADRIRLAEAMGWKHCQMRENLKRRQCWEHPFGHKWFEESELPDPFTDANDDYAVLEWMREKHAQHEWPSQRTTEWMTFINHQKILGYYQVGDYARAALKVIDA